MPKKILYNNLKSKKQFFLEKIKKFNLTKKARKSINFKMGVVVYVQNIFSKQKLFFFELD